MKRASLFLALLVVACGGGEAPVKNAGGAATTPATSAASAQLGVQYAAQHGCNVCHVVPGVEGAQGSLGPALGGIGSRPTLSGGRVQNTPANLAQYIQNPASLDPQSSMPALGIPPEHAKAIADYLLTLK